MNNTEKKYTKIYISSKNKNILKKIKKNKGLTIEFVINDILDKHLEEYSKKYE